MANQQPSLSFWVEVQFQETRMAILENLANDLRVLVQSWVWHSWYNKERKKNT